MTKMPHDKRLFLRVLAWHKEGDLVIARTKKGDAIILNPLASAMWKILQQREWTVGTFMDAVKERLEGEIGELETAVDNFLLKAIEEGLITTSKVSLFQ